MRAIIIKPGRDLTRSTILLAGLLAMTIPVSGITGCREIAGQSNGAPKGEKAAQVTPANNEQATLAESAGKKLPAPSQKMLDDVLRNLKSFRIIDCALDKNGRRAQVYDGEVMESSTGRVLYESSDPVAIKQLSELLRIRETAEYPENFVKSSPILELSLSDGSKTYLGLNSGRVLQWNKWCHEAFILDQLRFVYWLTQHRVTRTARNIQKNLAYPIYENQKDLASAEQFVSAMPKSMRKFFGEINFDPSTNLQDMSPKYGKLPEESRLKSARSALSKQFPKVSDQIGALLEWEGKLTEKWANFQGFPIKLLLQYDVEQVLSKVKENTLTPAQWVGVSRYYSDLYFRYKFRSGYKPLDKVLKERIIKEVKATGKNQWDVDDFEEAMHNWIPPEANPELL